MFLSSGKVNHLTFNTKESVFELRTEDSPLGDRYEIWKEFSTCCLDSNLILMGGIERKKDAEIWRFSSLCMKYNIEKRKWTELPSLPEPVYPVASCINFSQTLFLCGETKPKGGEKRCHKYWTLNLSPSLSDYEWVSISLFGDSKSFTWTMIGDKNDFWLLEKQDAVVQDLSLSLIPKMASASVIKLKERVITRVFENAPEPHRNLAFLGYSF